MLEDLIHGKSSPFFLLRDPRKIDSGDGNGQWRDVELSLPKGKKNNAPLGWQFNCIPE